MGYESDYGEEEEVQAVLKTPSDNNSEQED